MTTRGVFAMLRMLVVSTLAALGVASAQAAQVSANGFLVRHQVTIGAPAARVYEALAGQVGAWWNPQHTYSGDARNLSIDARAGGCFCERLANGSVEHLRVVHVRQNEFLRMAGGLGPLQGSGVSGSLTWRLSPAANGTTLELTYGVGGYMPDGFEAMAPAVERVLGEQVERLKRFVETGAPDAAK